MKAYDGTRRAVETADTATLAGLLAEQVPLVEELAGKLHVEIYTLLAVQKELARRGAPVGVTLTEALAFVAIVETGFDKKLKQIARNEHTPDVIPDHSAN